MTQFLTELPPAQNPNTGRSITIATKTSPEMYRAIREIVERGQSPYDSVSSFVRAAIHRLILVLAQDTDSTLLPPILALLNEWSRRHFELSTYQQVVDGMENNANMLSVYIEHNDMERTARTLEDVAEDILGLKDSFWKRVCLAEFFKFQAAKDAVRLVGDRGPKAIAAYEMWREAQKEI